TALQNYAACPYKFVLQAIHRLAPREIPEGIDEISPLSRGSLIHEVQYELLRELSEAGEVPIRDLSAVQQRLEAVVERVARRWEDDLAPAIDRVWKDCIAGVKIDLREWLRRMSEEPGCTPWRWRSCSRRRAWRAAGSITARTGATSPPFPWPSTPRRGAACSSWRRPSATPSRRDSFRRRRVTSASAAAATTSPCAGRPN